MQGYWAVLAYTGIEEASNKIKKKCVSIRVKKFLKAVSALIFKIISNQLCQLKLLLFRENT